MNVRELFMRKLDGAEITPDPAVNAELMRKLARREFIRFNPARFNAYYLGGIMVAAVAAGIIFFNDKEDSPAKNTLSKTEVNEKISGIKVLDVPAAPVIVKEPGGQQNILTINHQKNNDQKNKKTDVTVDSKVLESEMISSAPEGINNSISKNAYLNDSSSISEKLLGNNIKGDTIIEVSYLSGCVPLKLHFNIAVTSFDSCSWTFGDGGYSNQRSPDWIFDLDGEYKVVVNLYREGKFQTASSTVIIVYPRPQARYEITPEKAVLPDDEIRFLNYSANAIKYRWSFGDGSYSSNFEPTHRYAKYSNYNVKLVATSEFGCSDSLIVMNAFSGSEYFINFPNAFFPNPDGPSGGVYSIKSDEAGQVFHPTSSGVTDYQLRIFSKRGILIFESSDVNTGWDGYFKGQMANPGVYIWKVRGSYRNGEPFVKMGDVTLLRN
jgi:PKD repeat protein